METDEYLTFIEVKVFEEDRKTLMSDDEYQKFQAYLLENHELGDFIPNTGGCQKIRWKLESNNKGKSGGVRVIYYVRSAKGKIYLITMYSKNEKDNLNEKEKSIMRAIVAKLTGEHNGKKTI